jgi:hypothetical protein
VAKGDRGGARAGGLSAMEKQYRNMLVLSCTQATLQTTGVTAQFI